MQKDLELFPIEKVKTTKLLEELVKNIGVISDDRVRFFIIRQNTEELVID